MFHQSKYFRVFLITLAIFAVSYLLANFLYNQRLAQLRQVESNISLNILELETQNALLADTACDSGEETNPALISEINNLAKKLAYLEEQRSANDPEVIGLKKYYSLLEIKDYLLLRERSRQCGEHPLTVLYFYSNKGDCTDCTKMGYVLTSMREDYDKLHIYAFDYNIGLSVIESLKLIYHLNGELPVLVIDRKPYYGFKTRAEVESLLPDLALLHATSTSETGAKR